MGKHRHSSSFGVLLSFMLLNPGHQEDSFSLFAWGILPSQVSLNPRYSCFYLQSFKGKVVEPLLSKGPDTSISKVHVFGDVLVRCVGGGAQTWGVRTNQATGSTRLRTRVPTSCQTLYCPLHQCGSCHIISATLWVSRYG